MSWVPTDEAGRQEFYRALISSAVNFRAFLCPHCEEGMAEFRGDWWSCPGCPARGTWESLAVTFGIDPDVGEARREKTI